MVLMVMVWMLGEGGDACWFTYGDQERKSIDEFISSFISRWRMVIRRQDDCLFVYDSVPDNVFACRLTRKIGPDFTRRRDEGMVPGG